MQDNAGIIHDLRRLDPQGDLEVQAQSEPMRGPCTGARWVLATPRAKTRKYEQERRAYKHVLSAPLDHQACGAKASKSTLSKAPFAH